MSHPKSAFSVEGLLQPLPLICLFLRFGDCGFAELAQPLKVEVKLGSGR